MNSRFGPLSRFLLVAVAGLLFAALAAVSDVRADDSLAKGSDATAAVGSEPAAKAAVSYEGEIQPLFNKRCVACHGCIGSPCNVKLSSFRALERGGYGVNPYSTHIGDTQRTGMDVFATTEEWRKAGFYPVISRDGDGAQRLADSMLYDLISTGHQQNQPGFSRQALMPTYKKRYDHVCPSTPAALRASLKRDPAQGMPYGLPGLDAAELSTVKQWLEAGAPGPSAAELAAKAKLGNPETIARWEAFFNDPDPRSQLVSRYIFDHVYLSTVVFEEAPGEFFKLVRSKTEGNSVEEATRGKPTPAIEVIDTPQPYDSPMAYAGVDRFFYRLKKVTTERVQKNHFLWPLRDQSIADLQKLFLAPEWDERFALDPEWGVGNPFYVYGAIPAKSRAQFMLENSSTIVGSITMGPVCLGQTSTYAVKDHFWAFFVDPEHDVSVLEPQLGLGNWDAMMNRSPQGNAAYQKAYAKALERHFPNGYDIDVVWDGGKKNPNAWLTVLRHETNTWVLTGRRGGIPRTQWLLSYSGFERIYYDTVAHFKYYGGDPGKLETLVFFNFLRQEFEDNFLLLLPKDARAAIRADWSRGVIGTLAREVSNFAGGDLPSSVKNDDPADPLLGIVSNIQEHLGPEVSGPPDLLNPRTKKPYPFEKGVSNYDEWVAAVSTITMTDQYKFPRYLPSLILIKLNHGEESRFYSLVVNRVYETQYSLVFENGEALPNLYTVSVYPTVVGGFPNLFMEFDLSQAGDFIQGLRGVESQKEFLRFRDQYAVLRNEEGVWPLYDWFNAWNFEHRPRTAGVFDLSYYDLYDSTY